VVIHPQGITITWMRPGRSLIQARCRGLSPAEQGPVVAVAFDTVRKYKAYMLTASGELLTMVIPFGKQTHICRVSRGSSPSAVSVNTRLGPKFVECVHLDQAGPHGFTTQLCRIHPFSHAG
jgi:hypothetical protein